MFGHMCYDNCCDSLVHATDDLRGVPCHSVQTLRQMTPTLSTYLIEYVPSLLAYVTFQLTVWTNWQRGECFTWCTLWTNWQRGECFTWCTFSLVFPPKFKSRGELSCLWPFNQLSIFQRPDSGCHRGPETCIAKPLYIVAMI